MLASSVQTLPALILPGHQATQGSRMPPSQVLPFPPRSKPAEPPLSFMISQGPLSLVKSTRVRSARPRLRSVARIWPTLQSSSSTTSP